MKHIIGISDLLDPPDRTFPDVPPPRAPRVRASAPAANDPVRHGAWQPIEPQTRRDPTEHDLLWLEGELGAALPAAYRTFLRTHGWTRFADPMVFPLSEPAPPGGSAKISAFLGFSSEIRRDLGFLITEVHADTLPAGTMPIASDDDGNLVLLGVSGPARDRVWLWDRECRGIDDLVDGMVDELHAAGVDTADDDEQQILRRWEVAFPDRRTRPPGFINVYAVADSFAGFVASLHVEPARPRSARRR